jgi:hypothetical protein
VAARGGTAQPASVGEGLSDVIRDLSSTLTAPDATTHAQTLMKALVSLLDLYHKVTGQPAPPGMMPGAGQPGLGAAAPGQQAGPQNLAALMGMGQGGPSAAGGPPSISPSGTTAEQLRRLIAASAANQGAA